MKREQVQSTRNRDVSDPEEGKDNKGSPAEDEEGGESGNSAHPLLLVLEGRSTEVSDQDGDVTEGDGEDGEDDEEPGSNHQEDGTSFWISVDGGVTPGRCGTELGGRSVGE